LFVPDIYHLTFSLLAYCYPTCVTVVPFSVFMLYMTSHPRLILCICHRHDSTQPCLSTLSPL